MNGHKEKRRLTFEVAVIALLVLAYGGLGLYLHVVHHRDIVYTHFAYIPIVLSGLWWGRWGMGVAFILAVETLLFRMLGLGVGELWGDVGRVSFFFIVAFCIGVLSERVMRARRALSISEEKYRLLIDQSLSGIAVIKDHKILFANPRFCDMLGYSQYEIVGKSIFDIVPEDEGSKIHGLLSKLESEGSYDLIECRFSRKDGDIVWTDVASSMTRYERQRAVLINAYNITDRKEAELKRMELSELTRSQEEQLVHSTRLAELGEMAAAVAHELNQPLTGIKNFAKNALFMIENRMGSNDDVLNNLQMISEQVDRAAKIISQMRELTRKSEQQFALLDVNSILKESVEFLTPQLRLSGVRHYLELAENLPMIMGDRIRLEQVFLNLLTNARQAMKDSDERHLWVRTYLDNNEDFPVVVEIEDMGKGFEQEDAEKLFAPFYSTKKAGQGTGLGLSISLNIIKNHNGAIEARGSPGKGAKFIVKLPVAQEKINYE